MSTFGATRGAHTPSTTSDNWTLEANAAGEVGKVKMISWGGRGTTSTGYRTRWTRPTTNPTGSATALTAGNGNPATSSVCQAVSVYATTQATLGTDPAGNLFDMDWNIVGGGGAIVLPLGGEWIVVNSATAGHGYISCRNVAGTDASLSTYGLSWEE
jgi:hypothetical protein